jgi:predicted dehydrogenase
MRVAIWGLGPHAINKLVPALSQAVGLELYGVCSRNADAVRACVGDTGCRGWTDAGDMLADDSVDAVYVATPIGLHGRHGREVLAAGKHLWVEKPLTSALDSTLALLETSRARGLGVCEALMYLYHPQFCRLREHVRAVGDIVAVHSRFGIPPLDQPRFRLSPELGGGALYDVGCYPLSAVHALWPDDRLKLVYADVRTRPGLPVDSDGEAVLELSSGAHAHLEWRINCAYRNEFGVWGTQASVETDQIFSKTPAQVPLFRVRDLRGRESVEQGTAANHFVLMLQAFRRISDDAAAAESERAAIAGRAHLLDQISKYARDRRG